MENTDIPAEASLAGLPDEIARSLQDGVAIPAHPLALTAEKKLNERLQRALSRYYIAAGAGGLAVGVHTTQFEIRDPGVGLFKPVLELAREEMDRADQAREVPLLRVGGVCGDTAQAMNEAGLLRDTGYHMGLLNLGALAQADDDALLAHCRQVGEVLPLVGFYLQPSAGGRLLSYGFWRKFAEIPSVAAIKVAPFHRYRTLDVVRAVVESGRDDLALYTGNDDNIVMDLLTPHCFLRNGTPVVRRFVGGLLGHWAVWTHAAVHVLKRCQETVRSGSSVPAEMLQLAIEVTDCNAAVFDLANNFQGSTAGIHELLRRQGLLEGTWCLDDNVSRLGPGQREELDRVHAAYPHLHDDEFVAEHIDEWMS